ncbi:MAG: fasciclin domain-containing protein [Gemmatimonadales bacterium]|nr:fasciclin domain-containing protein [Gemmatimonadales bacterium]
MRGFTTAVLITGFLGLLGGSDLSAQAPSPVSSATVVDVAIKAGTFKTLVKAVQVAGLVETLKGKGPFTVFAPTDAAFAKLPPGTIEALLADPAKLRAILTYHVVSGRVLAAQVTGLRSATTVNGQEVGIRLEGGKVFVGGAQVTATDVAASNGVIHVIDTVLLPPK